MLAACCLVVWKEAMILPHGTLLFLPSISFRLLGSVQGKVLLSASRLLLAGFLASGEASLPMPVYSTLPLSYEPFGPVVVA